MVNLKQTCVQHNPPEPATPDCHGDLKSRLWSPVTFKVVRITVLRCQYSDHQKTCIECDYLVELVTPGYHGDLKPTVVTCNQQSCSYNGLVSIVITGKPVLKATTSSNSLHLVAMVTWSWQWSPVTFKVIRMMVLRCQYSDLRKTCIKFEYLVELVTPGCHGDLKTTVVTCTVAQMEILHQTTCIFYQQLCEILI